MKNTQITLGETFDAYEQFLDKFKPKKTTDDCYTPDSVYEIVRDWACAEYGIDPETIVRPFWPGGDYERYDYPDGCTVLDNPPFSILSQIVQTYNAAGIRFFLFSPYLTCIGTRDCCKIICPCSIKYENGAQIDTSFVTNLDDLEARTAPDLFRLLDENEKRRNKEAARELPKYEYPVNVITAARMGWLCRYGQDFRIAKDSSFFIRALDSQRAGLLLSEKATAEKAAAEKATAEKAAAEKAAAEKWKLSARELQIVRSLK